MLNAESYSIIASLFPRLLGVIYFCALGAFFFQIIGLIGKEGILPLESYLHTIRRYYRNKRFYLTPMVFWLNGSDRMIMAVVISGILISIGLILGFMPPLMLLLLYILYLSIVTGGQDFLSFGWEGFLLEITVHAFFLSLAPIPNLMIWISLNLLLFRFHFYAGAVKLQSRDPNWSNLTAIAYHYQSQPLPNCIAWYFYKFPLWFQKVSCVFMFFVELIVPFGIFLTEDIRLGACFAFLSLQYFIWATGNFSYLNHLTVALILILLNNTVMTGLFGLSAPPVSNDSLWINGLQTLFGSILCLLQLVRAWQQLRPNHYFHVILQAIAPFHLANRYGIFAVMTTKRYEIVVEGSQDGLEWKEYTFKYKPSEISRRPRRISPYQPRIDWQIWFLPFSDFESEPWFRSFLGHLLQGTPSVLKLIRGNPFPDKAPKYIRALVYDYEFSSYDEKRASGNWWNRKFMGSYTPVLTLRKTGESDLDID